MEIKKLTLKIMKPGSSYVFGYIPKALVDYGVLPKGEYEIPLEELKKFRVHTNPKLVNAEEEI